MSRHSNRRIGFASGVFAATLAAIAGGVFVSAQTSAEAQESGGADAQKQSDQLKPVESEPHDFMEYINQPTYRRLKQAISSEPKNEDGWQSITSDALILAEAGNLLVMRPPQENADEWKAHAVAIRHAGSDLYRASKQQNFSTARQAYVSLIDKCNSCHDQFNDGRPNLQP